MKMNKIKLFSIAAAMILFFGCGSENNENENKNETEVLKISDLKVGDKLDGLTISNVSSDGEMATIKFSNELIIEGNLGNEVGPSLFYITMKEPLTTKQIGLTNGVINMADETQSIYLFNSEEVLKYIPKKFLSEIPDGWTLSDTYNGNLGIKVIMKDMIFETDRYSFGGEVVEVKMFNGEENPQIATTEQENKGVVNLKNLKVGDKIDEFTIKKIEYEANYFFNVTTEGKEFEVTGKLFKNEYEESLDFFVDESSQPKTKIEVDGSEYKIFAGLNFSNKDALLNSLNADQKASLNKGEEVPLTLKVRNLTFGAYTNKGRLEFGGVEFVK
jgi:hypothetical protein